MYEQFFNLNIRPFTTTPYVKHYYPAQSIQKALTQCQTSVQMGSGPAVVVGHLGTGKSLLLNLLAELFRDQYHVIHLGCARFEKRCELLQSILFNLNQPYRERSEVELRLALIDYLKPGGECSRGLLLLVDEAHHLSPDLLDELRLITNIVHENQPRIRMVVAGGQSLEENLTNPKLEPFNQRIAARCFLGNLVRDETFAYVRAHIERAGGDGQNLFTPCGLECIHETSGGCPRVINQLCDQAMLLAASAQSATIDQGIIREAWGDIQCIPEASLPGSSHANVPDSSDPSAVSPDMETTDSGAVIEFGELDDAPMTSSFEPEPEAVQPEAVQPEAVQPEAGCHEVVDSMGQYELAEPPVENCQVEGMICQTDEQDISVQSTGWAESFGADSLVDCGGQMADDPFALNVAEQNIKSLEVNQDHMQLLESVYGTGVETVQAEEQPENHADPSDDEGPTRNPLKYESPIWIDPAQDQPLHLFQESQVDSWAEAGVPGRDEMSRLDGTAPGVDDLRLTDHELNELDSVASAVERLERNQPGCVDPGLEYEDLPGAEPKGFNFSGETGHPVDPETPEMVDADTDALSEAERLLEQIRRFTDADQADGLGETNPAEALSNPVVNEEWSDTQTPVEEELIGHSRVDDRDMLVISRSEQLNARAAEADAEVPHVHEQPSTGNALRMDYHKLFEQLRDA
ncbi:MAG: AAA family ATPase [Mariniblastus sp.]|nr:AAA family ATPase [Mariniblastus sp.]